MAKVTNIDTIKLPASGAANVPAAVFFRYEDPEGRVDKVDTIRAEALSPVNSILLEDVSGGTMTVSPHGQYLPTASTQTFMPFSPVFHIRERNITTTNKPLDVTVNAGFVSGTVVFRLGNIEHRVYVVRE